MPKVVKEVENSLLEEKVRLEGRNEELVDAFGGVQVTVNKLVEKQKRYNNEFEKNAIRLNEIKEALTAKEEKPKNENAS